MMKNACEDAQKFVGTSPQKSQVQPHTSALRRFWIAEMQISADAGFVWRSLAGSTPHALLHVSVGPRMRAIDHGIVKS